MIGRRTAIGLALLCALALSAFTAQGASAETTIHTCKQSPPQSTGTKTFSDAHCKVVAAQGQYKHVGIAVDLSTETTATDVTTGETHASTTLKATVAGSAIELVAKGSHCFGRANNFTSGGKMKVSWVEACTYSEVTENLLGCKVTGKGTEGSGAGTIVTYPLTATTTEEMSIKVTPSGATPLAEFELTGCVLGPITIKVFGSVTGVPDGATVNSVHNTVTAEKTLRLQNATTGPVAGLEGTTTSEGRANTNESFTPLSFTTPSEF